jgi:hypothetical protein
MATTSIPRRISTALVNSLASGVVPRVGLEYIAVGRKEEVAALLGDLQNVAEGGASFRFVVGRYGSGKSFMLQLIRNYAMDRDFVVADADLGPERRLAGTDGHGVATYRELLRNISTKTRSDGGALAPILERWISGIQAQVVQQSSIRPDDSKFAEAVESRIVAVINDMEGMVHGFDFAAVISAYWRGHRQGDDTLKDAALRWLRGEYATKTEARVALGVHVMIDDDSWYEYLKLLAKFVSDIGYKGLIVFIDEAVYLFKITHSVSRQNNYEKLLAMFNDTMQGKAEHLGILVGGTPQFIEDPQRGLFSYEALRTRLAESRFAAAGLRDMSGPLIRLQTLTPEEVFVLLTRLRDVHATHHGYEASLKPEDLRDFMQVVSDRVGADALQTPREIVRDFVSVLNIIRQNPQVSFGQLIHGAEFKPSRPVKDPAVDETGKYSEFTV